jgi:hypothetical protein
MSRTRSTLATSSLAVSLALSSTSVMAQPSVGPQVPEQRPAPPRDVPAAPVEPAQSPASPDAAAAQTAAPPVTAASPVAPAPTPPTPPPLEEESPVASAPAPKLFHASGYHSLNVGFPMGSIRGNVPLANTASRVLRLEGGPELMIASRVVVGLNVAIGALTIGDALDASCQADDASCAGITVNLGVHLDLLLKPAGGSATPWIGIETGYEVLALSKSDGDSNAHIYVGNQLEIRAGVDFRFRKQGGWGPFIAYQLGTYTSEDATDNSTSGEGSMTLADQSRHGWLIIGMRGRL